MPFNSFTQKKIKNLAGEIIYGRGLGYFQSGAVEKIWTEGNKLFARVLGSQGNYEVEIEEQNGRFVWKCGCPYDGAICKHIVAAGLEFLDKKEAVISKAENTVKQSNKLREKLLLLSKEDLADMLTFSFKTHGNWKNVFLKEMAKKLDATGVDNEDKQQIYEDEFYSHFSRVSEILEEFNQYGGGTEDEEDEAYGELEEIKELFQKQKLNAKLKKEFFEKMFFYYDWDNSGLSDMVMDTVFEAASGDEDWRYIVKKLEVKKQDNGWRKEMITGIYKDHLKDEEKYLELRKKNLEHGNDYYDLVDFWHKKGEFEKAVEIAEEGVKKCPIGSSELLEYLFKHYKKRDCDKALDYLKKIYLNQSHFDNYKRLKNFSKAENWSEIDKWCRNLLTKEKEFYELAQIDEFNKDYDKVLAYVLAEKNDGGNWYDDKEGFAERIIDKYSEELLPFYKRKADKQVNNMGRESYKKAAGYAKRVKEIYCKYLNKENKWLEYINAIRQQYAKRKALIDEFKGL
ncbi:hypothetical protein KJ854_02765 [Patescibacteria group bacterium]|nr:hypothetical protein [Patescibacteria group bacterium]